MDPKHLVLTKGSSWSKTSVSWCSANPKRGVRNDCNVTFNRLFFKGAVVGRLVLSTAFATTEKKHEELKLIPKGY